MQVDILTPDTALFSGEASVVSLPGVNGSFQILNNHAPIISALAKGNVVVKTIEGEKTFAINSGIVEVLKNKIVILA
ncbi:MAG: ATP synthase F1 subunit epsilon [Bacteroidetes bacterium]|nr:ATP synthase F1 subunit epsilon [Bacteroidota bacterium]